MEGSPGGAANLAERRLRADEVRQLYGQYGPALLAYACSFVADVGTAEDVLHQVFLRLLQGDTVVPDVPVAYLYRAIRNAALNARRNVKREVAHDLELDSANDLFENRNGNREAALALQAALKELPEEQREVVVLRVWSGMTLEEAASLTGVSLNTAASRYRYALDKLRERLKPYERKGLQEQ
jgi:RNA polymerase sigma-70 factor (ECF subfamily)